MTGPSRFEASPEQVAINRRGVELCRAQLRPRVPERTEEPRTRSDELLEAARERARAERRTRRTDPTSAGASMGAALNEIRNGSTR